MDYRATSFPRNSGRNGHATYDDRSALTSGTVPDSAQGGGTGRVQSPSKRSQRALCQHRAVCSGFAGSHTVATSFCIPNCSHYAPPTFYSLSVVHAPIGISESDRTTNSCKHASRDLLDVGTKPAGCLHI